MLKTPLAKCLKVFQMAVILLLPVSCRTEAVKLTESGCSLIVENHLDEDLDFFIEGTRVATIKPGEERQFIQLDEGELKVAAQSVKSKRSFWAAFILARGKETRWKVTLEKMGPLPTSQAKGKITVKNLSGEPVRIRISGVDHEMLWENSEAVYPDFPPGNYTLEASGTKTQFKTTHLVAVSESTSPVWVIKLPFSSILMTNRYHGTLYAGIEGHEPVAVEPLSNGSIDGLKPGQYTLAVMDGSGRGLKRYEIMLRAGEAFQIDLKPSTGALSVINSLKVPLTIFHETRRLGECKGDGAVQFEEIITGESVFYAVDAKGSVVDKSVIRITPDTPGVWMIRGGYSGMKIGGLPSLLLKNSTGENLEIRIDGSTYGTVESGAQKIFPGITRGKKMLKALGLKSKKVYSAEIVFESNERVTHELLPILSFLTVMNNRDEDLIILLNGKKSALLQTKSSAEFPVKIGKLEIEAKGVQSLNSQIEKFDIMPDMRYKMVVHEFGAAVVLENKQSEPLKLSIDGRDLGIILPSAKLKFSSLEPGEHLIRCESMKLPVKWERKINLKTGDEFIWVLEK